MEINGNKIGIKRIAYCAGMDPEDYKAARIPYSRNHDSGVQGIYGGPFSHDITRIFPNFDADVNSPESYDFAVTDNYLKVLLLHRQF